jgi:ArsR family transcriptional regulator
VPEKSVALEPQGGQASGLVIKMWLARDPRMLIADAA